MISQEYRHDLPGGQAVASPQARSGSHRRRLSSPGLVMVLGLTVLCFSCMGSPETPPRLPQALSDHGSLMSARVLPGVPGLALYRLENGNEPWAIHLLRVELNRCELGLTVLEAPVGDGAGSGRSRVSELVAAADETVLAAVNGDFFSPEGRPSGTEIVAGRVRRFFGRPALAWKPDREPWIGLPELGGDSVVVLGWELVRSRGDGATEVIGGFPRLLSEGSRVGDLEVSARPGFAAERHPRTAVGFDQEHGLLWIVVVDGRQPGFSVGMTLPELTSFFEALGVEEALNLDGGGSSVMVFDGAAVSSPSDLDGERPVANALGVRSDPVLCRLPE